MTDAARRPEFDADEFAKAYPSGVEKNFWNVARNRIVEDELNAACRSGLLRRDSPILEVGCGPGIVVRHLRERGWPVFGSELGRPAVLEGIEHVVWKNLSATDLDEAFRKSVACVLLLDVIEHVGDDVGFLKDMAAAFPNCQCFIVSVPARKEAWSYYDEFYGHFRRYDRKTLSKTFAAAGLACGRPRYFFHALYFVAMAINMMRVKRNVVISATRRPALDRLIARMLWIESRVLPSVTPGLSLIATAVRPNKP